jgi:hypothetical protein
MKKIKFTILVLVGALIYSCKSNEDNNAKQQTSSEETESIAQVENTLTVEDIDNVRKKVESSEIKPIEVTTSNLREKIKQKWSKIHFYVEDNVIVKVKTYPHEQISKRTEEFYANKDGLVLVVIEDNGDGSKGKPKSEIDKMYYFSNGKLIHEHTKGNEKEFNIKESDAEELLSEFNEYIELFKNLNNN